MPETRRTISKTYYKLSVIADGIVYTSVEATSPLEAQNALMDRLSQLTLEDGMQLPNDAQVEGEVGKKIGFFKFSVQHLDARPLIP